MQNKNMTVGDILFLAAGELLASLVVVGIFIALDKFDWRVLTGTLVGSLAMVVNFAILSFSVNRTVDRVMRERGAKEMTQEEAEAFAAKHSAEIQNSVRASYLLRQILILGILVAAVMLKFANVVAAVVPLVLFRPILMAREAFRGKKA